MRRIFQLSVACLAAGVVSACSDLTQSVQTENVPTAGVRFINALPDTAGSGGIDFRFVDIVESNAHFAIPFRNNIVTTSNVPGSTLIQYKNARAGSRHFRIFLNDTLTTVASTVLKDSTVTLEADHKYTFILWGNARPGGSPMKLTMIDETVADPGAQVALRVINATSSPIDARQFVATGTMPVGATWANVAPFSVSTYVTAAPAAIRYNVQPAGGGAALFTDAQALIGAAATIDQEPVPGTTVAGSAVTAIVWPRSVAGSKTPQTAAFAVPAISFMWDRRPPRPPGV